MVKTQLDLKLLKQCNEIWQLYNIIKSQRYYVIFCTINVEPSNLVLLKPYYTDFDKIIITYTDQNGRPLEVEDRVNLALLVNK